MFNADALTASHRTDRMSANPIRILGQATFAIRTMRADDVTRKSETVNAGTRVGRAIRDPE
jgi:tRNA(Ser,Leu) C12 N-acetylase TAN1